MAAHDAERETLLLTIEGQGVLCGRFEDLRRLGTDGGGGCFSLIITARDSTTGDRVALKFFHPRHLRDQYRWQCFQREPTVLRLFAGRPDILQCLAPPGDFTVPFSNGSLTLDIPFAFYPVELASSDANAMILADCWDAKQKFDAFRAMCRAVQRIHSQRVVHRDLKPSNFLIMPNGTFRLSDFGVARDLSDPSGALIPAYQAPPGDLGYAAPEIMASLHDVDPSFALGADMYSLGAILFELFTRTPLVLHLFDATTLAELGQTMNTVNRSLRVQTYDAFVGNMAAAHPLPRMSHFGNVAPSCVLPLLDSLYQGLAAIDYRRRLSDFNKIFSTINTCIWMLQHEDAYRRLKALRARTREALQQKRSALLAKNSMRNSQ